MNSQTLARYFSVVGTVLFGCGGVESDLEDQQTAAQLVETDYGFELSGVSFRSIRFVRQGAASGGNGSYRRPYRSLREVERFSQPRDIIVVLNSNQCLDGGIALKRGQVLLGGTRIGCRGEECKVAAARSKICNTNDVNPRYEGDAIRLADHSIVRGVHVTRSTRFGILGKNVDGAAVISTFVENTVQTEVAARNFLPCDLRVRRDFVSDGVAILKMPEDELGCWIWPAAFPGEILSTDRSSQLFFSNIAAAAIGFLANRGHLHASIERTVVKDFTSGLVTGAETGPFGFAEGANGILLSTDGDARFHLDVNQVNISNSKGMTRMAECTHAAIFTQHHDTSRATVKLKNSLIREIGGCDGIDNQLGVLPGVLSDDTPRLQVRLQDDSVNDWEITSADDPDLGPKHKVALDLTIDRTHVINPFNPVLTGTPDNPMGQDPDNPANQFTDAFEPITANGLGSRFKLRMYHSTMIQNAGNGWELRFGADSVENITTPNLDNVSAVLKNNCVFDNARSDDLFRKGSASAPNLGRDTIPGRDFHEVHLFLPPNPSFVIKAQRNYWGRRGGLLFDRDAEKTQIIAIENDSLAPGSSSSYLSRADLFRVFDARRPLRTPKGCFFPRDRD